MHKDFRICICTHTKDVRSNFVGYAYVLRMHYNKYSEYAYSVALCTQRIYNLNMLYIRIHMCRQSAKIIYELQPTSIQYSKRHTLTYVGYKLCHRWHSKKFTSKPKMTTLVHRLLCLFGSAIAHPCAVQSMTQFRALVGLEKAPHALHSFVRPPVLVVLACRILVVDDGVGESKHRRACCCVQNSL